MDFRILAWDEISGEVVECVIPPHTATDNDPAPQAWTTDHVIDLPDGTRIVLERSNRGHTAVLVTQPIG